MSTVSVDMEGVGTGLGCTVASTGLEGPMTLEVLGRRKGLLRLFDRATEGFTGVYKA